MHENDINPQTPGKRKQKQKSSLPSSYHHPRAPALLSISMSHISSRLYQAESYYTIPHTKPEDVLIPETHYTAVFVQERPDDEDWSSKK
ncbi:hypothetical protein BGAL_0531g00090 [Botrytis galanthina]|uniref:Uncharacterized protein n=1 Tax=Botrytis galanthina TaxID=278940 RepID=A0A4S8QUC6_9HELO|nr:hypothetical protein BGAL_0531g00090 [Botrytis galanthina]